MTLFTFVLLHLLPFVALSGFATWFDARAWNKGICASTGEPWKLSTYDSQGGRRYASGLHSIWISWPVDYKGPPPHDAIQRLADLVDK